jgi:hypothetical protein
MNKMVLEYFAAHCVGVPVGVLSFPVDVVALSSLCEWSACSAVDDLRKLVRSCRYCCGRSRGGVTSSRAASTENLLCGSIWQKAGSEAAEL